MADYDELIKALRCKVLHYEDCEARGCKYIKNGWCYYYRMIDAADAIEFLQAQVRIYSGAVDETVKMLPIWIPANEQLPYAEYGEGYNVLTVDSFGEQRVLYFDGGNWCWPTGECFGIAREFPITHWMPLPQPPKED